MVKGVSKTVIVVNNTGSKLFEKIVFYVTPEYGSLNAKQLKKAASSFSFNFEDSRPGYSSLRKKAKKRKLIRFLILGCSLFIGLIITLAIIL